MIEKKYAIPNKTDYSFYNMKKKRRVSFSCTLGFHYW